MITEDTFFIFHPAKLLHFILSSSRIWAGRIAKMHDSAIPFRFKPSNE